MRIRHHKHLSKQQRYGIKPAASDQHRNSHTVIGIGIGEYYASRSPVVISTLLGSCVSACLFDRKRLIGGMNHILMPGKADLKHYNTSARFGVNAMELLINAMMSLGALKKDITAKVFGGARVIPAIEQKYSMGSKIVDFVITFLEQEHIKILNQDIGGTRSRKLYFHTYSGDVFLRRGPSVSSPSIADVELKKLRKIEQELEKQGTITLFE